MNIIKDYEIGKVFESIFREISEYDDATYLDLKEFLNNGNLSIFNMQLFVELEDRIRELSNAEKMHLENYHQRRIIKYYYPSYCHKLILNQ